MPPDNEELVKKIVEAAETRDPQAMQEALHDDAYDPIAIEKALKEAKARYDEDQKEINPERKKTTLEFSFDKSYSGVPVVKEIHISEDETFTRSSISPLRLWRGDTYQVLTEVPLYSMKKGYLTQGMINQSRSLGAILKELD